MLLAMWKCIRCHTELPESTGAAEPNIDDFGLHFMCSMCGRRNRLTSLGEDDEAPPFCWSKSMSQIEFARRRFDRDAMRKRETQYQ